MTAATTVALSTRGAARNTRTRAKSPTHWIPWILLAPGLIAMAFAFIYPLVLTLRMSFNNADTTGVISEAFNLNSYADALGDPYYWGLILRTLGLGITVAVITVIVSYPIAYFLTRTTSPWKSLLLGLAIAPLIMSAVVRTYGWIVILGSQGLINSTLKSWGLIDRPLPTSSNFGSIVVAMVEIMMPFAILGMLTGFGRLTDELVTASSSLGAGKVRTFSKVVLPLTLPGVFTAGLLAFVLTISSFVTPQLVGGGKVNVLAIEIFNQTTQNLNWPLAAALSVILLVFFGAFVYVYQIVTRRIEGS